MPTYEYECTHCRNKFEKFQSIVDKPLQRCPKCKYKVKRLLGSGAGIIFKGTGFYETDYKRKKSTGNEEKPAKAPDSSSAPAKTEKAKTN